MRGRAGGGPAPGGGGVARPRPPRPRPPGPPPAAHGAEGGRARGAARPPHGVQVAPRRQRLADLIRVAQGEHEQCDDRVRTEAHAPRPLRLAHLRREPGDHGDDGDRQGQQERHARRVDAHVAQRPEDALDRVEHRSGRGRHRHERGQQHDRDHADGPRRRGLPRDEDRLRHHENHDDPFDPPELPGEAGGPLPAEEVQDDDADERSRGGPDRVRPRRDQEREHDHARELRPRGQPVQNTATGAVESDHANASR